MRVFSVRHDNSLGWTSRVNGCAFLHENLLLYEICMEESAEQADSCWSIASPGTSHTQSSTRCFWIYSLGPSTSHKADSHPLSFHYSSNIFLFVCFDWNKWIKIRSVSCSLVSVDAWCWWQWGETKGLWGWLSEAWHVGMDNEAKDTMFMSHPLGQRTAKPPSHTHSGVTVIINQPKPRRLITGLTPQHCSCSV